MKKNKLNLKDLKVKSFITSLENNAQKNLKGGETDGCGQTFDYCYTLPVNQCNVPSYNAGCPTVPVATCNVPTLPIPCRIDVSQLTCIEIQATAVC